MCRHLKVIPHYLVYTYKARLFFLLMRQGIVKEFKIRDTNLSLQINQGYIIYLYINGVSAEICRFAIYR